MELLVATGDMLSTALQSSVCVSLCYHRWGETIRIKRVWLQIRSSSKGIQY